jgi:hypothetical protein
MRGASLPRYDLDIPREDTLILHEDTLPMVKSSDLAAYRCPTSSAELVRRPTSGFQPTNILGIDICNIDKHRNASRR